MEKENEKEEKILAETETKIETEAKNKKNETEETKSGNSFLKFLGNIIYWVVFVVVLALIAVVGVQRFSENSKSIGGYRIFRVATESMEPIYEVGDVLLAKEMPATEISKGDNVVYLGKEEPFTNLTVTHQVIQKWESEGETHYITKGTANEVADAPITHEQVYGKVVYNIALLSFLSKALLSNMYVFFIVVFIPLALAIVVKIIQIAKEKDEEEDEDEIIIEKDEEKNNEEDLNLEEVEEEKTETELESEKEKE